MKAKTEKRAAGVELLRRGMSAPIEAPMEGDGSRVIDLCFATETPVRRRIGGEDVAEVLEVSAGAVNLDRLNAGGPLLLEHEKQIGGVSKAWVDADGKARARVKFSRSRIASDVLDDVRDGIARCVSVGYVVDEWKRTADAAGAVMMRAVKWTAHEISIVAMPADCAAGVGRSSDFVGVEEIKPEKQETKPMSIEVVKEQRNDAREIATLGNRHNAAADAAAHIERGDSVEVFKTFLIERQAAKPMATQVRTMAGSADGEAAEYSLINLIRARTGEGKLGELEEHEHQRLTRRYGGVSGFAVPGSVFMKRDVLTTATSPGYVPTLQGDYVAPLMAESVAVQLGATVLSGLNSKIQFPKGGASVASWLGETEAVADSDANGSSVTVDSRRLAAKVQVSKKLIATGGGSVEQWIRNEIVSRISLAADAACFGVGGGNVPTGVAGTAGVGLVAAAASRAAAVSLEAAVRTANGGTSRSGFLMTPAVAAVLKSETPTAGRFTMENDTLLGHRAMVSTQAPDGQLIYSGDWSRLLLATWGGGLDLVVDDRSAATTGTILIIGTLLADVAVLQPGAFAILD